MSRRVLGLAYAILGVLTLLCFGGPFLIGSVLRGGADPNWPPDRPIEWGAMGAITGLVVVSIAILAALWARHLPSRARVAPSTPAADRVEP